MPTAVERLLFLKLALVDDFAEFIGAHEHKLNDAFLKIDADFLKLSSAKGDSFLKIEHELKHDFDVIGDAFQKVGRQFEVASILGDAFGNHDLKIFAWRFTARKRIASETDKPMAAKAATAFALVFASMRARTYTVMMQTPVVTA